MSEANGNFKKVNVRCEWFWFGRFSEFTELVWRKGKPTEEGNMHSHAGAWERDQRGKASSYHTMKGFAFTADHGSYLLITPYD